MIESLADLPCIIGEHIKRVAAMSGVRGIRANFIPKRKTGYSFLPTSIASERSIGGRSPEAAARSGRGSSNKFQRITATTNNPIIAA
ncbi:hypothetical protein MKX50_13745 [Paenibacillus sp. FSL W8-0186]|uniref:hypothetical protein n=1 Tax=Paenibacillus sp. FSL W8-0186 TaxID=2921709 RepID=UPI0030D01E61